MPSGYEPLFSVPIWDQGEDLWAEGKITLIQGEGSRYEAEIRDDETAHVRICFAPLQMQCDCAYAKTGRNCAHMAALCQRYERDVNDRGSKVRRECEWHRHMALLLDEEDDVIDMRAFIDRLHLYLMKPVHRMANHRDSFDDYLDLYAFLLDTPMNSTPWQRLIRECIMQLSNIRKYALHTQEEIGQEGDNGRFDKLMADMAFLYVLDDYHYRQFDRNALKYYFNEAGDALCLSQYIKQVAYDHESAYVEFIFETMQKNGEDEVVIAAFCEKHVKEKKPRLWLMNYYRKSNQAEKGIRCLEEYCFTHARAADNIAAEQLELFLFYIQAKRHAPRDAFYPIILKERSIDKIALFAQMRSLMSSDEWRERGRLWMLEYMAKASEDIQMELIMATRSVDLLLKRLLPCVKEVRLQRYYPLLYSYDPGIFAYMIAVQLKELMRKECDPALIFTHLRECFPQGECDSDMIKRILIQIKTKIGKGRNAVRALAYLEDHLHEINEE